MQGTNSSYELVEAEADTTRNTTRAAKLRRKEYTSPQGLKSWAWYRNQRAPRHKRTTLLPLLEHG